MRSMLKNFGLFALCLGLSPVSGAAPFVPLTTPPIGGGEDAHHVVVDVTGVKDLWLQATSGPDDYHNDRAAWGNPILVDRAGHTNDMTRLKPVSSKTGWGTLMLDRGLSSAPLKIGSRSFEHGFFAHAPSALHFSLNGEYTRFEAHVGIGTGAGKKGSSEFRVLAAYDDTRMQNYPNGKPQAKAKVSVPPASRFDAAAMKRAIRHMAKNWPRRFKDHAALLNTLETLSRDGADPADQLAFQSEVLLRNPLLDFDQLLVVRRSTGNLGLPANWQSNSSIKKTGYDNQLVKLSLHNPEKATTLYQPEAGAFIGDLDLHFDGDRLLYSSIGGNGAWQVFELNLDGSAPRQVTQTEDASINNYDACYLPRDHILFTSTAPKVAVPCVNGNSPVANLFKVGLNGLGMEQLCFDQEHAWCPQMLDDGRVLYARWEYADLPHSNSRLMMTMNPDGTNQRSHYGTSSFWPNSIFYARQIPGNSAQFVGIVTGHHGVKRMGELVLFDTNLGYTESRGVMQRIPGFGEPVEALVRDRLADPSWPKYLHPYPLSDTYFLVAAQLSAGEGWGLYLVDTFDNLTLLHAEPGFALLEPTPIQSIPTPPVIPEKIDRSRTDAEVFIGDIYEGPGLKGIPRGEVKQLRLFTYTYGYNGMGGLYGVIGLDGPWDMRRILGTVPVEPDGSALFRIPANTPIALQPLDDEGKALQLMRSWLVARPGESLSCVGCHEQPKFSTPVKASLAARKGPVDITPWYGPARNFEFQREVQPVLDRYCVGCHDGSQRADHKSLPDLRGERMLTDWNTKHHGRGVGGNFSQAYFNLYRFGRHPGIESEMPLLTPMEFHADTHELIMMIEKGHHGVELDTEGMDRLVTWLDLNAPYHGRWSTVRGAKAVQNEEARAAMRKLYSQVDENHEMLPDTLTQKIEPILPAPEAERESIQVRVEGWPFDARARQDALTPMVLSFGKEGSMELVYVPAGRFVMGSAERDRDEWPPSVVTLARGFWMGRFEVSNQQFQQFDSGHNSRHEDRHGYQFGVTGYPVNAPDQPVVRVSWQQARAFCEWLSQQTGRAVSLPTEAQWEWACRAGADTPMHYGRIEDDFSTWANLADQTLSAFSGNPYEQDWKKAQYGNPENIYDNWIPQVGSVKDGGFLSEPGGRYQANAWGLHDMHGNVAEWTASLYRPYPYLAQDGRNDLQAAGRRVIRGGSWYDRPQLATASFRRAYRAYQPVYNVGFRVVIEEDRQVSSR